MESTAPTPAGPAGTASQRLEEPTPRSRVALPVATAPRSRADVPVRSRMAAVLGRTVSAASRAVGKGGGTMIGGRLALRLDPAILTALGNTRQTVLVTGTNGKSTTSRLLAAALSVGGPVVAGTGANRIPGLVSALVGAPAGTRAALETREAEACTVIDALEPAVLILLNLSREHADRSSETTVLERTLRAGIAKHPDTVLVANCDDVRITSIAFDAPTVVWVAAGLGAEGVVRACPRCGGLITVDPAPEAAPTATADAASRLAADDAHPVWRCSSCSLARPTPDWTVDATDGGGVLIGPDAFRETFSMRLPGRANLGNAAQTVAAATLIGIEPRAALRAVADVADIGGRYSRMTMDDHVLRLLLGKNPAAARESVSVVDPEARSAVLVLNEDGDETSDTVWVWDVDYSPLTTVGPLIVASGDRAADMSVRLAYDGVPHAVETDVMRAIRASEPGAVDVMIPGVDALQALERTIRSSAEPQKTGPDDAASGRTAGPSRPNPMSLEIHGTVEPVVPPVDRPAVRIGLVLPETLAASGDRGNALVLRERLRLRGYDARIVPVGFDAPVPDDLDVYLLGGNESDEQRIAVTHLQQHDGLRSAVAAGAPVLAVRAGAQILGHWYEDDDGVRREGLGLLDVTTTSATSVAGLRAGRVEAGEITASCLLDEVSSALSGFDSSHRRLVLGSQAQPLARVFGVSSDAPVRHEGAVQGSIVATSMQGPVLARNPELADLFISRILGVGMGDLALLEIPAVDRLRAERLAAG